jgi:hypothetical protein
VYQYIFSGRRVCVRHASYILSALGSQQGDMLDLPPRRSLMSLILFASASTHSGKWHPFFLLLCWHRHLALFCRAQDTHFPGSPLPWCRFRHALGDRAAELVVSTRYGYIIEPCRSALGAVLFCLVVGASGLAGIAVSLACFPVRAD